MLLSLWWCGDWSRLIEICDFDLIVNYFVSLFIYVPAGSTYSRSTYFTYLATYWYVWTIIILTYAWSIIFVTCDQCKLGDTITCWHVWTIIILTYAWSIIFVTPDQRCVEDARDQSHIDTRDQSLSLLAFDQSFSLPLISVVSGIRVINHILIRVINHYPDLRLINHFHYPWSALCRGYAWSVTFIYAWSAMTGDQPCTCTPDQPWRLISVNYIKLPLINHFHYPWSATTPDQRKIHI